MHFEGKTQKTDTRQATKAFASGMPPDGPEGGAVFCGWQVGGGVLCILA